MEERSLIDPRQKRMEEVVSAIFAMQAATLVLVVLGHGRLGRKINKIAKQQVIVVNRGGE